MPVKVLPQPPEAVEKPALSHGHGDNNYRERYHNVREQGELVDNRIYDGGLGYRIEERDLFYFFDTFGPVQHAGIITEGGNSQGYGFMTFHCKEVVKRLVDTEEGEGLVLKGRNLYIGAARQRHGQPQHYGRGQGQGLRRPDEDRSQGENSPGKESAENLEAEPFEPSQPIIHQPASYDPPLDPGLYYPYDPSVQLPFYPELSYPIYYPQYPAYSTPTPDLAWYPTTQYQDMAMVPQDAYTAQVYQVPTPPYPVAYSSSPEGQYPYPLVLPADHQFPASGPYLPDQPPMYPVIYNYSQPALHYSTSGQILQPVPGCQEPVPALQDVSATQEYQHSNYPGYSEDPKQLGDSGFQDSTSSFLDSSGCQDQSNDREKQSGHGQGQGYLHQGVQGQDVHPQRERDSSLSKKPSSKPTNPPRFSQQKTSGNSNQDKQTYTKLKNSGNDRNADNQGFNNRGGARDSRVYPSPYKSFSPYTGNLPPRQFPFPPGPRPYFPGEGRGGRGRIWGYNSGGRQGDNPCLAISKKKQGKKGPGNEIKKAGIMENVKEPIGLSGNQPDILQGPLENLEIK